MNTDDLYQALEERREVCIVCITESDFEALRRGIYRARQKFLTSFAMIDDSPEEDGYQLSVKRDKETGLTKLELTAKKATRQWEIVELDEMQSGT